MTLRTEDTIEVISAPDGVICLECEAPVTEFELTSPGWRQLDSTVAIEHAAYKPMDRISRLLPLWAPYGRRVAVRGVHD